MNDLSLQKRFAGRTLLIATKHQKEKVIAPLLEKALGVRCITNPDFDTDQFGTFSGEVERTDDPLTTLRKKCMAAAITTAADLVVGSEGSFGPHPLIGMIPANEEWMMLIDRRDTLEIVARELRVETNFAGSIVKQETELLEFARRAQFPHHALILRPDQNSQTNIHKGITDQTQLVRIFHELLAKEGSVYVETDMRALFNPTRLEGIRQLTEKMIRILQSACPACQTPGFDVVEAIPGLPCSYCGLKTRSTRQLRYRCRQCQHEELRNFPNGKEQEDPMYCDFCNP